MSNISFYNNLPKKGEPHKASGNFTINEFLGHVKYGKWRGIVEPVRQELDKKKRDLLKKNLIAVTISGVFGERKENLIIQHSGFICIDIDNYTDKSQIVKDPYTYACLDSVSGLGFAVIVKIDPAKHKESFKWIQKYYYESYGIIVDPAPQNPASLRYVTYDPTCEINEKSKISKIIPKEAAKPKSLPIILSGEKVDEYVLEAVNRGLDIASAYHDYLNLSFALVDGFGEAGRRYFHSLCSVSAKYSQPHAEKQYDIAIKRGKSGISVGTFYYMLKTAGIDLKPEANNSVAIAVMGKSSGREKEAIVKQLVEINNVNQNTAEELVQQVFERDDISLQKITFDPEKLIETLKQFIDQNHNFKRNLITKIIEEDGRDLTKERLNTIYLRTRAVFNKPEITFDLCERMIFSEFTPNYHPIAFYIEQNQHRKTTGHLDKLVQTIETKTPMHEIFIRKWCVSIIAAYNGYAVRSLLALLGGQYSGKTEWFRRLLPKDLQKYYGESKLDAGKDDELLMCSKLILMNDEMGGKSKHDEKLLKELTSKSVFSLRAPYGRHNEDFKRLAILCGTSNEIDIMQDPTGNTRIFPVEVLSINHELYNSINKDDLFMELYNLYESGFEWRLTKEEIEHLQGMSKNYEGINFERECIMEHFLPPTELGTVEMLTATQIKDYIENNSRQQIRNMKYFGRELKSIFGKPMQKRGQGYLYFCIKKNAMNSALPTSTEVIPTEANYAQTDKDDLPF